MKKVKFPGGLLERIWFVSLITGIILKAFGVISWIEFLLIITIWAFVVFVGTILTIIALVKLKNYMGDKKDGQAV